MGRLKIIEMKQVLPLLLMLLLVVSCGSRNKVVEKKSEKRTASSSLRPLYSEYDGRNTYFVKNVLKDAQDYLGTPYKYAGLTAEGMDCSGLVYTVFGANDKDLPRRSSDMAQQGKFVEVKEIRPGDLLFFATSGGTRISHVGIVNEIKDRGEITFIHSSTSKGVIISSLNEKYWNNAFIQAQRIN